MNPVTKHASAEILHDLLHGPLPGRDDQVGGSSRGGLPAQFPAVVPIHVELVQNAPRRSSRFFWRRSRRRRTGGCPGLRARRDHRRASAGRPRRLALLVGQERLLLLDGSAVHGAEQAAQQPRHIAILQDERQRFRLGSSSAPRRSSVRFAASPPICSAGRQSALLTAEAKCWPLGLRSPSSWTVISAPAQ